ncbi:hypothetical protein PIROE2DRAFT_12200 [Piromyces sp. E2]|nr:hypothetical protein PIROE2DRAFT_12200 [Piromyces sp. E2]|eukprot:OUM61742.1 hypothetical protein PIROE2DRAFT_12200 [Piromyces sp. E2]
MSQSNVIPTPTTLIATATATATVTATATSKAIPSVWSLLSSSVNKAQYFCPLFSWFAVTYTYFAIGRKGAGPIWKYLFYVVTFGFFANIFDIIKSISFETRTYYDVIKYIAWIETYLYGLNEWGFVYINFKKIKACVKLLNNKIWSIFIFVFLIYILFCRTVITLFKYKEDLEKYNGIKPRDDSIDMHVMLYIPIGIVEIILIGCVIEQFMRERKSTVRNELSILFHSTLSRTLLISLLYIFIAITVLCKNKYMDFAQKCFWRVKGILGIVFLVDLLLLRIDLDQNELKKLRDSNNKYPIERLGSNISSNANAYQQSNDIFSSNRSIPSPYSQSPSPLSNFNDYGNGNNHNNFSYKDVNRTSTISSAPLISRQDFKKYIF